jgi:hypothetical protein
MEHEDRLEFLLRTIFYAMRLFGVFVFSAVFYTIPGSALGG